MQIVRSLDEIEYDPCSCVTLGTFDGVHLGHQALIQTLIRNAKQRSGRSVLLTFEPHPQTVLRGQPTLRLTTEAEKIAALEESNPDVLFIIPFTMELAGLPPEDFIRQYMIDQIGLGCLFTGFNHAFGKDKQGTKAFLEQLSKTHGFHLQIVDPVYVDEMLVSSSQIRALIQDGNVKEAAKLLGKCYALSGTVVQGKQVGEKLGFPTANLEVDHPEKVLPTDGVYAVYVKMKETTYSGTCNIGFSPTIKGEKREIEIFLHDYAGDLYSETLKIQFVERLRNEMKFNTVDELVEQMEQDRRNSERLLSQSL